MSDGVEQRQHYDLVTSIDNAPDAEVVSESDDESSDDIAVPVITTKPITPKKKAVSMADLGRMMNGG